MPHILSRLRRKEQHPEVPTKAVKPLKEALKGLKVAVEKKILKLTKSKTRPSSSPLTRITTRAISALQKPRRSRQSNVQQRPDVTTPSSPPVPHLCSAASPCDHHHLLEDHLTTRSGLQQVNRVTKAHVAYVSSMQTRAEDAKDELAKGLETHQVLQHQVHLLTPTKLPSSQSAAFVSSLPTIPSWPSISMPITATASLSMSRASSGTTISSISSLSTIPSLPSTPRIPVAHTSESRESIYSLPNIPSLPPSPFPATASVPMSRAASSTSTGSISSLGSVRERGLVNLKRTISNIDASFVISTPKKTAIVTMSRSASQTSSNPTSFSSSPSRFASNTPASTSSFDSVVTNMHKFVNGQLDDVRFLPKAVGTLSDPIVPLGSTIRGMLDFVNSSRSDIEVVESRLFKVPTPIDKATSPLRIRRAGPKRPMLALAKFESEMTSQVSPLHIVPRTPTRTRKALCTPSKKNRLRTPVAQHHERKISSDGYLSNVSNTATKRAFQCSKVAPTFSTPTSLASWANAKASDIAVLGTPSPLRGKQARASFYPSPTRPLRPRGKENTKVNDIMIAQ